MLKKCSIPCLEGAETLMEAGEAIAQSCLTPGPCAAPAACCENDILRFICI